MHQRGLTVLLVEHYVGFALSLSDRVIVLDEGVLIAEGTPEQVRNDERVITAYLGRAGRAAKGERAGLAPDIPAVPHEPDEADGLVGPGGPNKPNGASEPDKPNGARKPDDPDGPR